MRKYDELEELVSHFLSRVVQSKRRKAISKDWKLKRKDRVSEVSESTSVVIGLTDINSVFVVSETKS